MLIKGGDSIVVIFVSAADPNMMLCIQYVLNELSYLTLTENISKQ